MKYIIDKTKRPVYLQIYKQLKNDIVSGAFPYGSKLPSKRILASEIGVSTITIEHAYALLCEEGYTEARERSGFVVIFKQTDGFASSEEHEKTVNLTSTNIINNNSSIPSFPVSLLSKTMRKVLSEYQDVILNKSPNLGIIELRNAIKQYLARNRDINVDLDQIVIGAGAEYLYGLIVFLLGNDKIFAIENPSYHKLEQIYQTAGVNVELLPLSDDGIDSVALANSNADVLHTTPYRSYPTGITASASKRHEYIRWANKENRYIIESDYGSEFSVSTQPTETLFVLSQNDNVIYLNTFSKTLSPSMRIGYMVLPKKLVKPFEEKLGFYSCTVPTFEQYVLAELIKSGDFERHINRIRRSKRRELEN
jgi:GntR family transcriptional regulator / MocR family aminotransferase